MPKPTDRALSELRQILGLTETDLHITLQCAITRIKRLAAPAGAQAPVAWLYTDRRTGESRVSLQRWDSRTVEPAGVTEAPLYTAPPAASEDAERLDWLEQRVGIFANIDRITSVDGRFNRLPTLRAAIDAARDGEGVG